MNKKQKTILIIGLILLASAVFYLQKNLTLQPGGEERLIIRDPPSRHIITDSPSQCNYWLNAADLYQKKCDEALSKCTLIRSGCYKRCIDQNSDDPDLLIECFILINHLEDGTCEGLAECDQQASDICGLAWDLYRRYLECRYFTTPPGLYEPSNPYVKEWPV